jgi:hypothetical protein
MMANRITGGRTLLMLGFAVSLVTFFACSRQESVVDEAKQAGKTAADFPADDFDYFAEMDMIAAPSSDRGAASALSRLILTPDEIKGRNTWMMWAGGNEAFWDWLANHSYGFLDLLKLVDFNPQNRYPRFAQAGLIVEPGTRIPDSQDEYGLYVREPTDRKAPAPNEAVYGRSSGILGLRLFKNPNFNDAARRRWDVKRYYADQKYFSDPTLVRPYRVGMSCGFCHVGPHPLSPPADVEQPEWRNLSATIGNQYLRTLSVFGNLLTPDSFIYHVLDSQPRGAIDTSLIATDGINNPNTQNAVWEIGARLDRSGLFLHRSPEYANDYKSRYSIATSERVSAASGKMPVLFYNAPGAMDNPRPVPRVLFDGADSVGAWGALARVYLNIGTFHQRWNTLHNPLLGMKPQRPFKVADAQDNSVYWQVNDYVVDGLAKYFLKSTGPMRLKDAPGGAASLQGGGVPWDPGLARGRYVFATHCIVCHSSKQPKGFDAHPAEKLLELLRSKEYQQWAHAEVEHQDFWVENYLSTDRRLPISLVTTNAGRALATNGIAGNMWEDFSSETYKGLPASAPITVWNPFSRRQERWQPPAGGRGWYRPASLVGIWGTAPFLHNNSVGRFTNDPSVEGRLAAFDDAIAKLLTRGASDDEAAAARWTHGTDLNGASVGRLQSDHGLIWRLPQDAYLRIPANQISHLLSSATGVPIGLLQRPWLLPVSLLLLSGASILTRCRLLRLFGFILLLLALLVGVATYFAAGRLTDLVLGPIPAGVPVNSFANIDPDPAKAGQVRSALFRSVRLMRQIKNLDPDTPEAQQKKRELGEVLLAVSKSPDFVMDRGHYFARTLTDEELKNLIALLRTF